MEGEVLSCAFASVRPSGLQSQGYRILPVNLRLASFIEPRNQLFGSLHPEGDREDITWFHALHQGLIERP